MNLLVHRRFVFDELFIRIEKENMKLLFKTYCAYYRIHQLSGRHMRFNIPHALNENL
jgi:hypothetical protein